MYGLKQRYGAGGGLRTHGLLRERIASRHDPLISCDLKSAAFDLAWLLPQILPVGSDLSIHIVGVWEDGGPRRI